MLFKFLDYIRTKPRHVREQYALGATVSFMLVVVGIWSLSLPTRFASISGEVGQEQTAASPFSHLIKQVKDSFSDGAEAFKTLGEQMPSATTTPDGPATAASSSSARASSTDDLEPKAQIIMIGTSSISTTTP